MEVLDIFGIIIYIVLFILCYGAAFYIFLVFSNKQEVPTPGIKMIRFQIILSLAYLLYLPFLFILDFLSKGELKSLEFYFNYQMPKFTRDVFMVTTFIIFLNHCMLKIYSCKKKTLKSKILTGMINPLIWLTVYFASVYVIYSGIQKVDTSANMISIQVTNFIKSESNRHYLNPPLEENLIFSENITLFSSFCIPLLLLGLFANSIFFGSATGFFPLRLIDSYFYRPTLPDPEDHVLAKRYLLSETKNIAEKGKMIYALRHEIMINVEGDPKKIALKKRILKSKMLELKDIVYEYKEICQYYDDVENILERNPLKDLSVLIIGIVISLISLLLVAHVTLSIKDKRFILEGFLEFLFERSSLYLYSFILLISYYLIIGVFLSIFQFSSMFAFLDFYPVEINKTWTDTFLINLNITTIAYIGFLSMINTSAPIFFSFLRFNVFFIRFAVNIKYISYLFKFKVGRYLFILFFFTAVFISFFMKKGKVLLREKVKILKKDIDKQRFKMEEAEKLKNEKKKL